MRRRQKPPQRNERPAAHASSASWATARASGQLPADVSPRRPDPASTAPTLDSQSTSTRLELREIRRAISRKRRNRRLKVLALMTVLVVGGTAGYLNLPGRDGGTPAQGNTSEAPGFEFATQETALLQVRGADGDAVASALLAHDPAKKAAAVVQVPSRLAAEGQGGVVTLFGQTLRGSDGPAVARRTLSDLLGVRIDDSWVLDQAAFAKLVGRVDGITIDLDADIIAKGAGKAVLVPKGNDRALDGAKALAVLNYRATGKDELDALPRIQAVLQAVLAKLPEGGPAVSELAGELGDGSDVSDVLKVPRIVDGVRVQDKAHRNRFATVPVLAVVADGQTTYRVEPVAATRLVGQMLAGSARLGRPEQGNRVLALDGVGKAGFGASMRERITPAGFTLVDTRKEASVDRKTTVITIFDTTSQSTIRASQLASALGLPMAKVEVSVRTQNIADLIVRVGSDFKP